MIPEKFWMVGNTVLNIFFFFHFIYPGKFTLSYKASSQRLPELVF